MKSIVIILASIFLLSQDGAAQTVFAPQGAVWNYYFESDPPNFNLHYWVEKETMFGGYLCAKVNGTKTLTGGGVTSLPSVYFRTTGDTVLYYHDSLKDFTPLYIFNVKTGDTITLIYPPTAKAKKGEQFKAEVLSVFVEVIDGLPLRTVLINPLDMTAHHFRKYTERIGAYNVSDLMPISGTLTANHIEGIRCYRDEIINEKFVSDKWDCDYVPNNINEMEIANDIRIFPNPVHQELFVEIVKHNAKGQIQLLSLDGRIVNQQKILEMGNKLDLSSISNGLYFLTVSTENERISKLISIIH